jgi:hypothetical protein
MRRRSIGSLVLACTPLALAPACARVDSPAGTLPDARSPTATEFPDARPRLLERVAVIGASASRGFGLDIGLADALTVLCGNALVDVRDCSSSRMFIAPLPQATQQVECAREAGPTLVVALDFLFWFGYGFVESEEQRLEHLEQGLQLLERFDCPVVVGRFPDMSAAVGRMLLSGQMPDDVTLERLNARLADWASERSGVLVVPLDRMLAELHAGQTADTAVTELGPLLQADELHPTQAGELLLARAVLAALADAGHALVPLVDLGTARAALEARAAARGPRERQGWR